MPSRATSFQSTLRCAICDTAEAAVVKTSAVWTMALACATGTPIVSMAEVEITPKAIPSAPSIN